MDLATTPFLGHGVNMASALPLAPMSQLAALLLAGLTLGTLLLVSGRCDRKGAKALLGSIVVVLAATTPVPAQTTGPDYSQVSDFLNGQRSLLNITDLQLVSSNPDLGLIFTGWITTSNSQPTLVNGSSNSFWQDSAKLRLFSARLFNQPQAATITAVHHSMYDSDPVPEHLVLVVWPVIPEAHKFVHLHYSPLQPGDDPLVTSGVTADFTLDGYDDLAIGFDDGRLLVATPKDRNNFQGGFRQNIASLDVLKDMAAGDFKGDGKREIAGLTVLPNGGLKLVVYAVDPQSLAITPASSLILTTPGVSAANPITHVSMTRGRFNGAGHDQLAVAFASDSGPTTIEVIDFTPNTLAASEASSLVASTVGMSSGYIQLKTGEFALPGNPLDQIAYHSASPNNGGRFFEIVSVDSTSLMLKANAPTSYNEYPCGYGIAVGNFDHQQPDPTSPGKTEHNPNAQIALLGGACDSGGKFVNVYSADPNNFGLTYEHGMAFNVSRRDSRPPTSWKNQRATNRAVRTRPVGLSVPRKALLARLR